MMGWRKWTTTAVAGALLATSATPALARPGWSDPGWGGGWGQHHRRHRGDGIDTGDIILGAIIIGGIAAVASAAANSDRYGDRSRGGDWGGGWSRDEGTEDQAVDACARAAEREGARYGRDARVEDITSVKHQDGGWRVRGVISAERGGYGDKSRFTCSVRYGQVDDVRFEGERSAWDY